MAILYGSWEANPEIRWEDEDRMDLQPAGNGHEQMEKGIKRLLPVVSLGVHVVQLCKSCC